MGCKTKRISVSGAIWRMKLIGVLDASRECLNRMFIDN